MGKFSSARFVRRLLSQTGKLTPNVLVPGFACLSNFSIYLLYKFHNVRLLHLRFLFVFPTHGGDEEDRTPDPLRARQVLSQLSYTPIYFCQG